ncbi:MAG: aminoacyl-tRNA hydrolase [Bdellovibrionales bacterium]|nr:aminoacyl-tRNA hydrolase [Bdellovibrionales bacterium]
MLVRAAPSKLNEKAKTRRAPHEILTGMLEVTPRIRIPMREFTFRAVRSSGPGGQHVNKTSTCAELRWSLRHSPTLPDDVRRRFEDRFASRLTQEGDLVLQSDVHRSLPRNKDECLSRLRGFLLQVAEPPKPRRPTKPTRSSGRRRVEGKRHRSEVKKGRSGGGSGGWD